MYFVRHKTFSNIYDYLLSLSHSLQYDCEGYADTVEALTKTVWRRVILPQTLELRQVYSADQLAQFLTNSSLLARGALGGPFEKHGSYLFSESK